MGPKHGGVGAPVVEGKSWDHPWQEDVDQKERGGRDRAGYVLRPGKEASSDVLIGVLNKTYTDDIKYFKAQIFSNTTKHIVSLTLEDTLLCSIFNPKHRAMLRTRAVTLQLLSLSQEQWVFS